MRWHAAETTTCQFPCRFPRQRSATCPDMLVCPRDVPRYSATCCDMPRVIGSVRGRVRVRRMSFGTSYGTSWYVMARRGTTRHATAYYGTSRHGLWHVFICFSAHRRTSRHIAACRGLSGGVRVRVRVRYTSCGTSQHAVPRQDTSCHVAARRYTSCGTSQYVLRRVAVRLDMSWDILRHFATAVDDRLNTTSYFYDFRFTLEGCTASRMPRQMS